MATASSKSSASMSMGKNMMWTPITIVVILVILIGMFCLFRNAYGLSVCKTQDLKLTAGQQSGAAGTIYQHMVLTNTSKHKCRISGYPTAFLYGSSGYALGNSAAAAPQPAPVDITLDPNTSANTVLGYPQAGNFNPGVCSAQSVSLKLFPPSSTTSLDVPLAVAWCPGFSETSIQPGS